MKKTLIIILILLSTALLIAAKWSTYDALTAGNIADSDDVLVRDVSDTTLDSTGTQKRWTWSAIKQDLLSYFYDAADDQVKFADSSGGEITSGNAVVSAIGHLSVTMDPGSWYDTDTEVFLFTVGDDFPSGVLFDEWKVSCNVDPDVEMDLDLKYADSWIGLASSAVIDVLNTTNGTASEDTDANINSGSAVANGKVIYLSFGADPEGTCVQMIFEAWYHPAD